MGVKWTTEKPHDLLDRKKNQLRNDTIPDITKQVAERLEDEIRRKTPHGVKWVPPGSPKAAPVKTSNLIRSIKKERSGKWATGSYMWSVSTDKHYAPYVEYGTSPHIIRPKGEKSLVYYTGGDQTGAKLVRHPGTKGVHMFQRGVATMRPKVKSIASPYLTKWANSR